MIDYILLLKLLSAGLIAFGIVFISIPTILTVANTKNLYDEPSGRRVHKKKTPTLGGLAIFFGIALTFLIYADMFEQINIPFLIPAALIIFSIGIKDDILVTAPIMKLLGQFFTAFIIVGLGKVSITDFHGFFGLNPDPVFSFIFSILFFVFIINGFNLIDGVDGLASVTGIITISSFTAWFYINNNETMSVLGVIIIGSLIAFTYYNMFSKRQKIFMGDTGSLLIGFFVAFFAIMFMESNVQEQKAFNTINMTSAPSVAFGVMIVPIIDTLRVFLYRISRGKSPFQADKTHVHHRLLALGFSHITISLMIGALNIVFVIISFSLKDFGTLKLLLVNLISGWIFFQIPSVILGIKRKKTFKQLKLERKNRAANES